MSVLDRERRPISDLTAHDFTVLENGLPQAVTAFTPVTVRSASGWTAPWMRDAPVDVQTNRIDEGRLFVVFIDDQRLNGPLARERVHAIGRAFVSHLARSDRTAVVYVVKQTAGQEFTTDPSRVLAAVERFDGRRQGFVARPLDGLSQVIGALAAMPGRRKAVVYIGFGEDFDSEVLAAATSTEGASIQGSQWQLYHQMRTLFRLAQLANVNIYGVDVFGLLPPTADNPDPGRNRREFMQIVSHETGGTAIVNNNEPEGAVPRILEENGSYYLLGYQSTNPATDGKYRRITVTVNRPDVEVRARGGYYAPRPEDAKAPAPAPEYRALVDVLPTSGLPMAVALAPFAHEDSTAMSVAIALALPAPGEAASTLQTIVSVFDADGKELGSQRRDVSLGAGGGSGGEVLVLSRLDLPRGAYHVRFSAHDLIEGKTGSVYADVAAPDFAGAPLSLSGVILHERSAIVGVHSAALAQLIPVTPTTNRTFAITDEVGTFVRVYQGGVTPVEPADIRLSLVDANDKPVFSTDHVPDRERFSPRRAADFTAPRPLARLQPGPYLLRIDARLPGGASAQRQVRIAVR